MTDAHIAIAMVLVLIAGWIWIAGPEGVPDGDRECPWPGKCECTEKCERREK